MPEPTTRHDDDDQAWFDLIAGRSVPDAALATRRQAAWLRAALLAFRAQAPAGGPAPAEQRIERLLQRARAVGVLAPPAPPGALGSRRLDLARPRRWHLAAALAVGVAAAVVLPTWVDRIDDETGTVVRGGSLQTRRSSDPAADRDALQRELRAVGIDAVPYQRLDRWGLDVELPRPLSVAQRAQLTRLGLVPPEGTELRVEWVAAGAQR